MYSKDGSTVRWYASIFDKKYGTVFCDGSGTVRLLKMVRVRFVGTLFELKITDVSRIAPVFCMQKQKSS